jgi:hypothetical protein
MWTTFSRQKESNYPRLEALTDGFPITGFTSLPLAFISICLIGTFHGFIEEMRSDYLPN